MVSTNITAAGSYLNKTSVSSGKAKNIEKSSDTFGIVLNNTNFSGNSVSGRNEKADLNDKNVSKKPDTDKSQTAKAGRDNPDKKIDDLKKQMDKEKKSLKEAEAGHCQLYEAYAQSALESDEQTLKKSIADKLGISAEELNTFLDEQGISIWDFKDAQNAMKLVMLSQKINDVSDILVDMDMTESISKLSEEVSEIVLKQLESMNNEATGTGIGNVLENSGNNQDDLPMDNENIFDGAHVTEIKIKGTEVTEKLAEQEKDENAGDNFSSKDENSKKDIVSRFTGENVNTDGILKDLTNAITDRLEGIEEAKIISQVIEEINVNAKPGMTSLEIQLYPEHLGKVVVEVSTKDGILNAKIAAETENAKNAIEGQLTLLKESLNNQGIKVESVEVTIAGHGFEENLENGREKNNESDSKKRTVRKSLLEEINELDKGDEITEKAKMEAVGNTVSYKA